MYPAPQRIAPNFAYTATKIAFMDNQSIISVQNVLLTRRGYQIMGSLLLLKHHMVFTFRPDPTKTQQKEIWICFPIIDKILKARGSSWESLPSSSSSFAALPASPAPNPEGFDKYLASHIKLICKDFTFYSFDFQNETACAEVFTFLSKLAMTAKVSGLRKDLYAFEYRPNMMEAKLQDEGWGLYDIIAEYRRQQLLPESDTEDSVWRLSNINANYKLCSSYPLRFLVPNTISDSVLQHASKFRLKQRIPAVVYKHRSGENCNIIARCAQPLIGLNFQNRSLQDEKLVEEIFRSQEREKRSSLDSTSVYREQPQRNLIVDLRPISNAMAQHALGAGTENVENYKGRRKDESGEGFVGPAQRVDKIFCNIDNIHVMRNSLNKLVNVLNDLDRFPVANAASGKTPSPLFQQALTKTQWLHRLSIILQSVDRITKSVHLNNTNVLIHCSDGWDRTSQVSALLQLCLDPYFRTMKGFMVLVEKEWLSFGFKFATRADHGACVGAFLPSKEEQKADAMNENEEFSSPGTLRKFSSDLSKGGVASFLLRAASHIKNTASAASSSVAELRGDDFQDADSSTVYSGSSEKSPIFHQFLDCVYQILRQNPCEFEFNSRFLKRLFYHHYSCQYGTFLCDSEYEASTLLETRKWSISVWDYFLSRPLEFLNPNYELEKSQDVIFFNYSEAKWWFELYGRSDEEMNGLSNSLDRKFAQLKLGTSQSEGGSRSSLPA